VNLAITDIVKHVDDDDDDDDDVNQAVACVQF